MQKECFLVSALQRIDELFVFGSAQGRDHQSLRLAAGEQRRTVGPRQYADFRHDLAHGFHVAAVDALAGIEDVPANDLGFEFLEHAGNRQLVVLRFGAFGEEVLHHLLLDRRDCILTILLAHDGIGRTQVLLGDAENLLFDGRVVGNDQLARFFRGLLGEFDDRLDHRLEVPMAEHHRAEHDLFGQFLCFRLHHHHRVLRAGDDEIELALVHLVDLRVEHIFVVDEADARSADRPHERSARQRERSGRGYHRHDVRIVLLIMREHGDGHLRVAAPAFGEQRTDRAVDQTRGQRILFGRPALALEIAAGYPACRVVFFGVVDRERKEIDSFLRLLG